MTAPLSSLTNSVVAKAKKLWLKAADPRWYGYGMRATIDKAGRVVIPKTLRDAVGLTAGEVELVVDGAGVRIEPVAEGEVSERNGKLIIPESGSGLTHDIVEALRRADQR